MSWMNAGKHIYPFNDTFSMKTLSRHQKTFCWDFPGTPVVKNSSSNAGDMGSIPGQGTKIPHATGQLSL